MPLYTTATVGEQQARRHDSWPRALLVTEVASLLGNMLTEHLLCAWPCTEGGNGVSEHLLCAWPCAGGGNGLAEHLLCAWPCAGDGNGLLSTYCMCGPAQGVDSLLLTGASEKQRPELNQKPAS